MIIKVINHELTGPDSGTFTVEYTRAKPGTERKLAALGRDLTDALQDGKIDLFEAFRIIADLKAVQ